MKKRRILFVGDGEGILPEGLSYAADLAGTMKLDLAVLLVQKLSIPNGKKSLKTFFPEKVRIVSGLPGFEEVTTYQIGVSTLSEAGFFLESDPALEMVLISPSITRGDKFTAGDLNRFVKETARPVVLISKQEGGNSGRAGPDPGFSGFKKD
jgi:hypothetical protein